MMYLELFSPGDTVIYEGEKYSIIAVVDEDHVVISDSANMHKVNVDELEHESI